MGLLAKVTRETPVQISADFLEHLFAGYPYHDFRVCFCDGSTWGRADQPRLTLVLEHPGALRAMFLNPSELTLGEAYIYNDFDIEGDIESVYAVADYVLNRDWSQMELLSYGARLLSLPETTRVADGPSAAEIQGLLHT